MLQKLLMQTTINLLIHNCKLQLVYSFITTLALIFVTYFIRKAVKNTKQKGAKRENPHMPISPSSDIIMSCINP
jgi:hypothetical protein